MDTNSLVSAYRLMLTSRAIDDECAAIIAGGGSVPNYHSGRGQEALSTGVGISLTNDDYMLFGYRDFGALMAKGVTLDELVCDLLLKVPGTTGGYGGIMHVVSPEHGVIGRNSVFGSRFGIAVGLGLSAKQRGHGQVVMCPYGEAEGSRGPLYEAINVAILWKLPIVFAPQNNGYSMSSRTADLYAGGNMSSLWRGAPMTVASVDANDLEAVCANVGSAVSLARAGQGPSLVELVTYRIDPHIPREDVILDAVDYRSEDEIDAWRNRDPILRLRQRLTELGIDVDLDALQREVASEVRDAFERAHAADDPSPETMHQFIYREAVATNV
jgi:acetoin:2,6-dichlorophenolindophenol oxidoreductase subunit alpha